MIHIVLFQPEIPQNTGNIARTCVGFNAILHLIKPYGFVLSYKKFRRSVLDYFSKLKLIEHIDYDDFVSSIKPKSLVYFITRYGKNLPTKIKKPSPNQDIYLVFGQESKGLPKDILQNNIDKTIRIPTSKNIRSLNLANCVAILTYEITSKFNFNGLELKEPHKIGYFK